MPRHTDHCIAGYGENPIPIPGEVSDLIDECGLGHLPQLPTHKNPGLEIVHVRRGKLFWQCEGKQESVGPDTAYFTLPWQQHGSCTEYESGHEWAFIVIHTENTSTASPSEQVSFPKALGFDKATHHKISSTLCGTSRHAWPATPQLREVMSALVSELKKPGAYLRSRTIHSVSLLVLELAAAIERSPEKTEPDDLARFSPLISQLKENCEQAWTLDQMAGLAGLKHAHFTERFRRTTGDTPIQFLHRLRMDRARHLLKNSEASITWVALECGYCSSQHFARVFKEFCGVTALEYRKHGGPPVVLPRR